MYEALQPVTDDLENLKEMLASPTSQERVARVSAACEAVAQQLSEATRQTNSTADRAALQTLYRGFLATSRLVQRLHELQTQAGDERHVSGNSKQYQ